MKTIISIEDKKIFIGWILENRKLKRRESVWILNYILGHENILENVRFMEEAHYCPRAIVMSTTESDSIPFRFYSGNLMSADAEKTFHDIKSNPEKEISIQINFSESKTCLEYLNVCEDNEYMPESLKEIMKKESDKVSEETEALVSMITASNSRVSLMNEIDKALDSGDKELFMQLAGMLNDQEELKVGVNV